MNVGGDVASGEKLANVVAVWFAACEEGRKGRKSEGERWALLSDAEQGFS